MIVASVSAFAAETPAWAGSVDASISIEGLQKGDTVKLYKVLEYDQTARTTGGWKFTTAFNSLSSDNLNQILGLGDYAADGSKKADAGITAALAGTIASKVTSSTAATYTFANITGTSVTQNTPEAGLYVAIITPAANSDTTYNPVFVGADYYTNSSNGWTVSAAMSYADKAMAKSSTVTLEKTAKDERTVDTNDEETVAVGDRLTFTVKTTIPGFADNYIKPVFKITDKLSDGLTIDNPSVTLVKPASLADTNYAVTYKTDGFELAFTDTYLKTVKQATEVEITYTAVVNSEALHSVNPEDNTVTLNYSTTPDDEEGHGVKRDKTNHYSFDIDAKLFGEENYEATEVVKVGVDKDGNEITETKQLSNEHWVGALENAEFKLYLDNGSGAKGAAYTNKYYNAESVFVSDGNGTLKLKGSNIEGIRGLDAGVYWLEETKAPDGYIKLQDAVKIEIKTVINPVSYTETVDGVEVTYEADELISYSVEIGGVETANYTMVNDTANGAHPHIKATKGDTVVGGTDSESGKPSADKKGKLQNTQGVELPSTGGMGTTILYVGGSILVILAAVLLITKRRMNAED